MKLLLLSFFIVNLIAFGQNQCNISTSSNPVCEGENVNLTVNHSIQNPIYNWSIQNQITSSINFIADSSISIYCIITSSNNTDTCITSILNLNVIQKPQLNSISNLVLCSEEFTPVLSFSSNQQNTQYTWNNSNPSIGLNSSGSGSINSFSATNSTNASIISQISVIPSLNGCVGDTSFFLITVKPKPQVNQINDQTVCAGDSSQNIIFNSNQNNATFNWTNNNTLIGLNSSGSGNINSFSTTNSTNSSIISQISVIPSLNGCSGNSIIFSITVKPIPIISFQTSNICSNSTINLQNLQGNNIIPSSTLYVWNVNNNSSIIGEFSNSNASTFQQTLLNNTNQDQQIQYSITPISNGCVGNSFNYNINIFSVPSINTLNNLEITCVNNPNGNYIGPISLPGYSYSWSPSTGLSSNIVSNPFANPTSTTLYTINVIDLSNNCSTSNQILVSVNKSNPISNAGSDAIITCNQNTTGAIIGMNLVNGIVYSWSPINGLNSINTSMTSALPLLSTTYTLTAYNPLNGCSSTDQVNIVVNKNIPYSNAGNDITISCNQNSNGAFIGMNPINGINYSWSPTIGITNANFSNTFVNPSITSTYTLLSVDPSNGCSSSDQIIVTVNKNLPIAFAGVDANITCVQNINGVIIGMQPDNGINYSWSPNINLSTNNSSQVLANPNSSTTYTLTALNPINGCFTTDQVYINVNKTHPTANAGNDATISCNQNQNGLIIGTTPSSGLQYSWSPTLGLNNVNTANPSANPNQTTSYTLNVTNPINGCSNNDQITVFVNNNHPDCFAGINQLITCNQNQNGVIIGMQPEQGITYNWTPSIGLQDTISSMTIAQPAISKVYTLKSINNNNGCFSIDSVLISVDTSKPIVFAGNDTLLCFGDTLYLDGNSSSTNNLWTSTEIIDNQNSLNTFSNPLSNCNYVLTATNINGCINSDTISVTISQLPFSNLNNSYSLCINESIQLSIDQSYNCIWGGLYNSTSNIISFPITESGILNLNLTNLNGCVSYEEILITAKELPFPNITGIDNLCQNSYWNNYSSPNTNNTIIWTLENGDFMSPNNINNVLVHWLTGTIGKIIISETNINGCSNKDSILVSLSNFASDTVNIKQLSSNVLYIDQDYPIIKWGFESINTGVSIEVNNNSQYCYFNNIDFSNYYYWVEVASDVYCSTKSYFNRPNTFLEIEDYLDSEISIFPNPTIDIININNVKSELNYSLLDIDNKVVCIGKTTNNTIIDLKDLKNGAYFLVIDCKNAIRSYKIIKL